MTNPLSIYGYDNTDYVIAHSPEDASALLVEVYDCGPEAFAWDLWPADVLFGRTDEDGVARSHVPADLIAARGRCLLASVPE